MLGEGGFGLVYLADDPKLNRKVALKIPRRGYFVSRSEEKRFFREAQSAARLRHPNIVEVFEVSNAGDTPYIASSYIEGLTLADLASGGLLSFREMAQIMVQVGRAVEFAHRNKIIHRDLKPSNILVDQHQHPYVTDFGLSRRDDAEITMTAQGVVIGTPAYMSPEQAMGQQGLVDAKSDVYSLGVTLYRLLCQELPFHGTRRMLLKQVIHDEPRAPRKLNENVPRDLETITLKAMMKQRTERYTSAAEFADELDRWLRNEPIRARPISPLTRSWRWCLRNPRIASLCATILFLLTAGCIASIIVAQRERSLRSLADNHAAEAEDNNRQSVARLFRLLNDRAQQGIRENKLLDSFHWLSQARLLDDSEAVRLKSGLLLDRLPKLTNQWNVNEDILNIRFNPSGSRCAIGTVNGIVQVFDTLTGKKVFEQTNVENTRIYALELTANDEIVFQSGLTHIQIWSISQNRFVKQLNHDSFIHSLSISDSGDVLVTGDDGGNISVWSLPDGTKTGSREFPESRIFRVAAPGDGSRVFSVCHNQDDSGNRLEIWDWKTDNKPLSIPHQQWINGLDFSQDQSYALTACKNSIRVWDFNTGEQIGKSIEPKVTTTHAFFGDQPDRIHVIDRDNRATTWNSRTGELVNSESIGFTLTQFTHNQPRTFLACASNDGYVKLVWRDGRQPICSLLPNASVEPALCFHPDGRQIAIEGPGGTIKVWDPVGELPSGFDFAHEGSLNHAYFSDDGERCYTIMYKGEAYIWDTKTGRRVGKVMSHRDSIIKGKLSPDGKYFATLGGDRLAKIWDARTGVQVGSSLEHDAFPLELDFSPDSNLLVIGCYDGKIYGWKVGSELADPKPVFQQSHAKLIRNVTFSSSGQFFATAGFDGKVICWDAKTGNMLHGPFSVPSSIRMWDCDLFPDNERILASGLGAAWIWKLDDPSAPIQTLPGYANVKRASITPKGMIVTTNGNGKVRTWVPTEDGFVPQPEFDHPMMSECYSTTSHSQKLAIGGASGSDRSDAPGQGIVLLFELGSGDLFAPPFFHAATVRSSRLNRTGNMLLTASNDQTSRLVNLRPLSLTKEQQLGLSRLLFQETGASPVEDFDESSTLFRQSTTTNASDIKRWNQMIDRWKTLETKQ